MKLTPRREAFVMALIEGKSQREAYKAAGYKVDAMTDKSIDELASRLFRDIKVRSRYDELHGRLIKEAEDEAIASAKDVLRELSAIAMADIGDYVTVDGYHVKIQPTRLIPRQKRGAIAGIKQGANGIEIKLHDKLRALELLGKNLGIFTDKVELSGEVQIDDARARLAEELAKRLKPG